VPLQALSAIDLDRLYAHLLTEGGRNGDGLSMRTVRLLHTVLRRALAEAERKDLLKHNPATRATPPSTSAARAPEFSAWSPEELGRFLELVAGHRHAVLFQLAAMTGMRRGEVCGLQWEDVDLDAGQLTVRRTLLVIDGHLVDGSPKTARSRRRLDLDPPTIAALRAHRSRQLEERLFVATTPRKRHLHRSATWGGWVSNPRTTDYESAALTAELPPRASILP
jgi:integrase